MGLTVAIALAAAVAFGWSTAAMHFATSGAPVAIRHPLVLLRHVVLQWRWATGMLASLIGLGLHAVALSRGSLAVVQPLVASGLVLALAFRAGLERRRPTRATALLSLGVGVALAVFLLSAGSTKSSATASAGAASVVLVGCLLVAGGCWLAANGLPPSSSGLLLGAGTGIVFGLIAGTLKAVTDASSVGAALTGWPLWVLIALGITGFFANQTTYRRASLVSALPMINVVNPVVALSFGVIVFGEHPGSSALGYVIEGLSLAGVLVGVFLLARWDSEEPVVTTPVQAGAGLAPFEGSSVPAA